jgi:aspartate/methionine/tyrosine aminotransferase
VQLALPGILALRPQLQERLIARLKANRQILHRVLRDGPATLLAADGGWSALLRLPRSHSDEQRSMDLLQHQGLIVQPGWYFDLPGEGWLVLGLLQPVELFEPAAQRLAQALLHQG